MTDDAFEQLARQRGVGDSYLDYRGKPRAISRESQAAIFAAMGLELPDEEAAHAELRKLATTSWTRPLPPVLVMTQGGTADAPIAAPDDLGARTLSWRVLLEDGTERTGATNVATLRRTERAEIDGREYTRFAFPLPRDLPLGYHRFEVTLDTGLAGELRLIVAPERCFQPRVIASGHRVWGLSVQLYSLRSQRNWGMGDFGDLRELIDLAAPLGCGIIGLNPLHALMPANPTHISPYSPSSRQFLNVLYVAVNDVPELAECAPAQELIASVAFQARLAELRATPNVDYAGVASAKFEVLKLLHQHFRTRHLEPGTPRADAFREFCATFGEPLQLHAVFDALDTDFRLQGPQYWGWPSWPEEYRDAASSAVNRFARDRANEVEYFLYLQWLAEEQLCEAQTAARDHGMSIGLYGDVAVGANPGGSETWANRRLYLRNASVGAPPDALALKGQDWGIPPQDPAELHAQQYEPFGVLIRNNMRPVAALRLDHVMTLYRLWWVPGGTVSTDGGYVHYPFEDLFAILALESQRNHCAVIGEDLGTVPEAVTQAMERYVAYHYKVLLFEQELDGRFKPPSAYVSQRCGNGHDARPADVTRLVGGARPQSARSAQPLSLAADAGPGAHATGHRALATVAGTDRAGALALAIWPGAAAVFTSPCARDPCLPGPVAFGHRAGPDRRPHRHDRPCERARHRPRARQLAAQDPDEHGGHFCARRRSGHDRCHESGAARRESQRLIAGVTDVTDVTS